MAIFSRFGEIVEIVRPGTLDDVRTLANRKPDKEDRDNLRTNSYVVVRFPDGKEELYLLAFLKADDGFREIANAARAVGLPLAK